MRCKGLEQDKEVSPRLILTHDDGRFASADLLFEEFNSRLLHEEALSQIPQHLLSEPKKLCQSRAPNLALSLGAEAFQTFVGSFEEMIEGESDIVTCAEA